jgi:hypothetical protein
VALVRTDVSDERIFSIISITTIGELGTTLAITSKPTHAATETSVIKRATQRNVPEDGILQELQYLY